MVVRFEPVSGKDNKHDITVISNQKWFGAMGFHRVLYINLTRVKPLVMRRV